MMTNRRLSSVDSLSRGRLGSTFCAIKTERRTSSWLSDFTVKDTIGRGRFAVVKKCVENCTGKYFAAKCIRKRRHNRDCTLDILHEIAVLELSTDHPHLIDLHRVYESSSEVILILEFAAGGEIFDHCVDVKDRFTEAAARRILLQILDAVTFLHENGIVHLDLKPQNILLTKEGTQPDADIKLVDFGLSKHITNDLEIREILGTPDYAAPEVLNFEPISIATDIWSLGVVCYVVLTGVSPFLGDTKQETLMNVTTSAIHFPSDLFGHLSPSCKDLIHKMLQRDPDDRITAKDSLSHPWIIGLSSPQHLISTGDERDSPSSNDEVFIFTKSTSNSGKDQNEINEHKEPIANDLPEYDGRIVIKSPEKCEQGATPNGRAPTLNLQESTDGRIVRNTKDSSIPQVDVNGNIARHEKEEHAKQLILQLTDSRVKQRLSSSDQAKVPDTHVTESYYAQVMHQESVVCKLNMAPMKSTDVNENSIQITHHEPKTRVIPCFDEKLIEKESKKQDLHSKVSKNHFSNKENSQSSVESDSSSYSDSLSLSNASTDVNSNISSPNLNNLSLASFASPSSYKIHPSETDQSVLFTLSSFERPAPANCIMPSHHEERSVESSARCHVLNSLHKNEISAQPNEPTCPLHDVFSGAVDPSQKRRKFDVFDRDELQKSPIED